MRSSTDILLNRLASLGFLVLFPGFAIYHYAVAAGWIPAFAGGLFGGTSLALAVVALLHLAGHLQGPPAATPILERAFVLFCLYLFAWSIVASLMIANRGHSVPALTESLATLSIWLATFFVGSRMRVVRVGRSFSLPIAALIIVSLFLHAMIEQGSFIGPFLVFGGEADADEIVSTYQGVGRSIMVTAIVIASLQRELWKQLAVLALAAVGLIALGSRAHLFATIWVILAIVALRTFRKQNRRSGIFIAILLVAVAYAVVDVILETRAGEIFSLGESTSWLARLDAHRRAVEVIAQSPFLGDFGYHHRETTGYAHNILSVWAQFGALAFLGYLVLLLYALAISALRVLRASVPSPQWLVALQFNLTALVLAIASEPVFSSVFPALGWALVVGALRQERHNARVVRAAIRNADSGPRSGPTLYTQSI